MPVPFFWSIETTGSDEPADQSRGSSWVARAEVLHYALVFPGVFSHKFTLRPIIIEVENESLQ